MLTLDVRTLFLQSLAPFEAPPHNVAEVIPGEWHFKCEVRILSGEVVCQELCGIGSHAIG